MHLCHRLCLSGLSLSARPSFRASKLVDATRKLSNRLLSYMPCLHTPLTSTRFITSSDLDFGFWPQDQGKTKYVGFIIWAHFQTDQDDIQCGVEAMRIEITAVLLTA